MGRVSRIINNYYYIACIPAVALLFDYLMTLGLSGGREMILSYEFSPLVRFAVENEIMAVYILFMIFFYYLLAVMTLRLLYKSDLYRFGVIILLTISIAHVLGGLSWIIRNSVYTYIIHGISVASIIIALAAFGYALVQHRGSSARKG